MASYFSTRFFLFAQRLRFEYLLRIDALSSSSSNRPEQGIAIEEDASSPGFVHLKILSLDDKEIWREYVDVAGRLRRDLVKAKLANLLAAAIKRGEHYLNCVSIEFLIDLECTIEIKQEEKCSDVHCFQMIPRLIRKTTEFAFHLAK